MRLSEDTGRKKLSKFCHLRTIAPLCQAMSSQQSMYRQSEKILLNSYMSTTCPYNTVNFGPLAAEIVSLVCRTPVNFNGFQVLAALLHDTLVVGVSQTLRC